MKHPGTGGFAPVYGWRAPTLFCIVCYLIYNKVTVGAAMPLSGATKSGFAGFLALYLTAAIHLPFVIDLKAALSKTGSKPLDLFGASFRVVQMVYPMIAGAFGAAALWFYRKRDARSQEAQSILLFGLCVYIVLKTGFNFLMVHPWGQAAWYYAFIMLTLSVLGSLALERPLRSLERLPIAKYGVMTIYGMLTLLSASQYYASIAYQDADTPSRQFWLRKDEVRAQLVAHGVTGIINVDDGITAFLLDLPAMHGFAFATDVEAQRAHRKAKMLTLARARGINTLVGFDYMYADPPPTTDAEIRKYLLDGIAGEVVRGDADNFEFSLAYYDPVLKLPFFAFKLKAR